MRATSIGHAGILVDTVDGSIVCDPWFLPQFHGSWFVFPRNDQLSAELMERICNPTYLYISHIHADHLDEEFLTERMNKDTTVLIPGYPTRELERILRGLGFYNIVRTVDGEELALGPNLRIAIHVETSITDGPGGDSAMVISDGTGRLVNQNDCRTNDLLALRNHGPVDLHWLQYSGAIWYPMVYQETPERMRELVDAKVDSQFARAMRYVETIGGRAVVPSAGPPAFLDPDLFQFNVIEGDELSIFPDQISFMTRLADAHHQGILAIPGTEIEFSAGSGEFTVTHPLPQAEVDDIFTDKRDYLLPLPGRLAAVARRDEVDVARADPRSARHGEGVVRTAHGDGAHRVRRGRRRRGVPRRRPGHRARLPTSRSPRVAAARTTASGSRCSASWSRPWLPSGPTTGATRCSCRAGSAPGARASTTSTSTTSSSRSTSSACAAPRPRPCASSTPITRPWRKEDIAHRRLDRATRVPAPRGRPQRVRRDRGRRVGLHLARLALRPRTPAAAATPTTAPCASVEPPPPTTDPLHRT